MGADVNPRRLLQRSEVVALLQIPNEELQTLIDTRQLIAFLITGLERFDSKDIYQLIEAYKFTASRRNQNS
jgi:hypothetical protein